MKRVYFNYLYTSAILSKLRLPDSPKCAMIIKLTIKVNKSENRYSYNTKERLDLPMNEKFFDLKKEKQDRMINAALKIFSMRGYQFASTDDIVKEAGISKGLLFHYFGSKSGLYSFIYDYSVRFMSMELPAAVDAEETNLFTLYKQIETGRLQALKNYPCMQLFLEKFNTETAAEALAATCEKKKELAALYDAFDAQADLGLLPADTDSAKLRNILRFSLKNLMEEHFASGSFQVEALYQENIAYIEFLEKFFTK